MIRNVCLLTACFLAACGGRDLGEQIEYARLQRDQGQLAAAVSSYRAALEEAPDRWDLRVELARVLLDRNEGDAARAELQTVLSGDPGNEGARDALVRSFVSEERYQEAVSAAAAWLEGAGSRVRALLTIAEVHQAHAGALVREVMSLARERPEILRPESLGLAVELGDFAEARRRLESWGSSAAMKGLIERMDLAIAERDRAALRVTEAIAADPKSVSARVLRAEIALGANRAKDAVADIEAALRAGAAGDDLRRALGLLVTAKDSLGDLAGALAAADQAVEADPADQAVHLMRALLRVRGGDTDGALRDADAMERRQRGSLLGGYVRGVVATIRGDFQAAQAHLSRATAMAGDPGPRFWLGLAFIAGGKREVGIASLKEALRVRPNLGTAHLALAWATLSEGRPAESLDHAERAAEILPGSPEVQAVLARACLARAEELSTEPSNARALRLRAEAAVQRIAALAPEMNGTRETLAILRAARGGTGEAVATVLEGIEARPEDAALLNLLGLLRARRGEADASRAAFEAAARITPDSEAPRLGLAGLEVATGRPEEAKRILREFLERTPGSVATRVALSGLLPPAEGLAVVEEGLRLRPDSGELHFARIDLLRAAGDEARVAAAAREACAKAPADPRNAELALHEIEAGRPADALAAARDAVERFADSPVARVVHAVALAAAGRQAEAAEEAGKARAMLADAPFAIVLLIDRRAAAGDMERARSLAEHAPGLSPAVRRHLAACLSPESLPAKGLEGLAARDRAIAWHLTARWPERTSRAASEALALLPDDPVCLEVLAATRTMLGDLAGVRLACRELLRLEPDLHEARVRIAETFLAEGRPAEARAELEAAVEAGLRESRGLLLLARLLLVAGERKRALDLARGAGRESVDPSVAVLVAAFEEDAGEMDAARETLDHVLSRSPDHPAASVALARVLARTGRDLPRARELAEAAVARTPANPEAHHVLALVCLREGRPEAALVAVSDALARQPERPAYLATQGEALLALDRTDEAESALVRADEEGDPDPRVKLALGLIADRKGEKDRAAAYYEAVLARTDRSVQASNNLACILLAGGREPERARELARRAVELSDRSAPALDTLAWAEIACGAPERAVQILGEALRKAPGHPDLLRRLEEARAAR